jgi:integrase
MAKRTTVPPSQQRKRVATGVYLKASGRYLATFRDPGRRQRWKEFATQKEAERWRAKALLDPTSVLSGKRTLGEVWVNFLDHHEDSLRPTTRANWEQEWRAHIAPALGTWPVGKITTIAVKDYMASLQKKGAGAPTRQKCRTILLRLFEEAVENGEVAANPVSARGTRVKMPQPKKARVLTSQEVDRLVEAARRIANPSDALAIETLFFLGLRIGELAGLQARDVDKDRGEIVIRRTVTDVGGQLQVQEATKTNKLRVLPVPTDHPLWVALLSQTRDLGLIGQAPLFPAANGGPIRPNNWRRRVWYKAMEEAKIADPPPPHSGRRTTASLLSAAGVPAPTVQAILGHSTLKQTGEYIDVSEYEMRGGLGKLGAVYADAKGLS